MKMNVFEERIDVFDLKQTILMASILESVFGEQKFPKQIRDYFSSDVSLLFLFYIK